MQSHKSNQKPDIRKSRPPPLRDAAAEFIKHSRSLTAAGPKGPQRRSRSGARYPAPEAAYKSRAAPAPVQHCPRWLRLARPRRRREIGCVRLIRVLDEPAEVRRRSIQPALHARHQALRRPCVTCAAGRSDTRVSQIGQAGCPVATAATFQAVEGYAASFHVTSPVWAAAPWPVPPKLPEPATFVDGLHAWLSLNKLIV